MFDSLLVTNDDGIDSPGLWTLVRAAQPFARRLTVVAPAINQSAVGAGFTLRRELTWTRLDSPPVPGVETWHVDGTPADCVMVALNTLVGEEIEAVVSGVNIGANVGTDVLASGTVGGALAGHMRGKSAIAFSQVLHKEELPRDWSTAEQVASRICGTVAENRLAGPVFLNVNIPSCRYEQLAGVVVTRMGRHGYLRLQELSRNSAVIEKEYDVHTNPNTPPGTDVWALANRYVSVSPLHSNLTDHRLIDDLGHQLNVAFRLPG